MEAENKVFEQPEWPIEIRKPEGLAEMAEGYRLAKEMLKPVAYNFSNEPKKFPPLSKLSALEQSAAHLQEPFSPTPINVTFEELPNNTNHVGVEQHRCVGCGDCMSGCNYGAKNTVLMNYLPDAKNHGAEIFTEISVRRIEKHETRWLIHYQILQTGEEAVDSPTRAISADVVVLAAGTLGSTEILLRSKEHLALSQRVGQNFTGNGDVLAFGYNCDKKINGVGFGAFSPTGRDSVLPCITGIIDARRKPNLQDCLVIEEGSMAGAFAPLLPQLFALAGTLSSSGL
jgi:cholesterol oxidase